MGCLLDLLTTTSSTELMETHIAALKLKSTESQKEEFATYVNQPVDYEEANMLHLAAQKNSVDLIWFVTYIIASWF